MKNLFKLSALAAVIVASATYASADTVNFVSNGSTVTYGGYSSTIADVAATLGSTATSSIGSSSDTVECSAASRIANPPAI